MKTILLLLLAFIAAPVYAQQKVRDTACLKGRIIIEGTESGIFEISIPKLQRHVYTNMEGRFVIQALPFGIYTLTVYGGVQQVDSFRIAVDLDTTDLGDLPVKGPGMTLQEADMFSSVMLADRATERPDQLPAPADPGNPLDVAVRAWGALGYRFRAYDHNQTAVYMNGLPLQDLESGTIPRGLWAGLNGMFVPATMTYGLQYGAEAYGSLTGTSSLPVVASDQPRQTRIAYGRSNGTWTNRLMLHHSTGMGSKGWAMALSVGKCWSRQGYVPGTYYDEYSFYLGISRRFNTRHKLHFTALATPVESGNTSAITTEAMTLAGTPYYNPNWGYQDRQTRNAKISKGLQPFFQVSYQYRVDSNKKLDLAAGYRSGYTAYSSLDWYNAQDPRPDYYKNLPGAYKDDPATATQITNEWLNNPDKRQLDWTGMYEANRLSTDSMNRYRSVYAWGTDRADSRQYSLAAHYSQRIRHATLQAGLNYEMQRTEHYRQMLDLLGGDYYVNLNQFAEQAYAGNSTFNQNDLNDPGKLVYPGDKYAYDYVARHSRTTVWAQVLQVYKRVSLSVTGHIRYHTFSREGLYRTGMFPTDSYGPSTLQHFFTYLAKGTAGYTFHQGHSLLLNVGITTTAPTFDHTFISPRSRNAVVAHPVTAQTISAEAGYQLNTHRLKGSLTVFVTDRSRITDIRRFYHEDYKSQVNYVMEGISIRHMGAELALEAAITKFMSATAALTWLKAVYQSRPEVSVYKDNDTALKVDKHVAYLKGYYIAGPQSAMLLGLNFRTPRYGYAGIRCKLLDRNYTDINPARRTEAATGLTLPGSIEQERILQQERLPCAFVIDLSVGKTFYLHKRRKEQLRYAAISLRVGVANILNNKNIITDAYEQLRFDFKGQDPDRFPNKYTYAYGTIYTIDLGLRF